MKEKTLGLIAGNGKFPFVFAAEARRQGYRVVAAAVRGDTRVFLPFFVDRCAWFRVGELRALCDYFKSQQITDVLMAGQVNPNNLFADTLSPDEEFTRLFAALRDRKADTIFTAIADLLKKYGMTLVDSTFLLKEYLAPRGTITKRGPTVKELADIEFGRQIAKAMGAVDVGQTVVIKDKAIVAIEAMEGTDRTIFRGGRIARRGAVVVKMSKPKQDMRFDVPVMGPRTIRTMIRVKAACIAIEAEKTIVIDQDACVRLANKAGICIVCA